MGKITSIILLYLSPLLTVNAVISPTSQSQAENWFYIKVKSVGLEKSSKHTHVIAQAQVLKVFFCKSQEYKPDDIITIFYKVDNPERKNRCTKRIGDYVSPRILKEGESTYAFLENPKEFCSKECKYKKHKKAKKPTQDHEMRSKAFTPSAAPWSFSPPQGIPEEQRKALGMIVCTKMVNGCLCFSKEVEAFHAGMDNLSNQIAKN